MARKRRAALLLVFMTVLAYHPVLNCDFVNVDDPKYVVGNAAVRSGLTLEGVRWAFGSTEVSLWHPVTWLSHMFDVQLWGLNPAGHHLTSLVLHAANAVLVLLVLTAMTGAHWRSLAVAALFALHPLRVESVAWVAERKDILSALFALLALWAYAGYARRPSIRRFALVAVPFAFALMSKAMVVTLPLVLLLLDHWPLRRAERSWRLVVEKLPLLALSGAAGVLALLAVHHTGASAELAHFPVTARLANALVGSAWYVAKTAWPARLAVFYPLPATWPAWEVVVAAILVGGTSAFAVATWRSRPYVGVGWLWFLVMIAPVSGLVQAGSQTTADRFGYLPLIGLFVVVVWGARDLAARWTVRPLVAAACAAMLLAGLALRTWTQVHYWRSSATLFSHALDVTSGNWMAHNNLGDALVQQGRIDEAVAEFTEALSLLPAYPDAHYNLGVALARRGQTEQAAEHYREALRLNPAFRNAHTNLGLLLLDQGLTEEAIDHLTEALRLRPDAVTHFNLGLAFARQGSNEQAIARYREVLRLVPNLAQAHYQLAQALAAQGKRPEADEHYAIAIRLRPDWARSTAGAR